MGRTISSHERSKISNTENLNKNKKSQMRKKNKNISKWGKQNTSIIESQVDKFELQSPKDANNANQYQFDFDGWES